MNYYSVTLVGGFIGRSQIRRFENYLNFVDLIKHLKQKTSNKEMKSKSGCFKTRRSFSDLTCRNIQ